MSPSLDFFGNEMLFSHFYFISFFTKGLLFSYFCVFTSGNTFSCLKGMLFGTERTFKKSNEVVSPVWGFLMFWVLKQCVFRGPTDRNWEFLKSTFEHIYETFCILSLKRVPDFRRSLRFYATWSGFACLKHDQVLNMTKTCILFNCFYFGYTYSQVPKTAKKTK